ncbi:MAG: DUF3987 domain-containing protein [Prevotellaceae bacterium]|nr:DUF3987 domain-containing protein [Prevotellaceae bacterium]
MRVLFVPANNSATGLFQILNDNKGVGLLFETEGDTLAQTFVFTLLKTENLNDVCRVILLLFGKIFV